MSMLFFDSLILIHTRSCDIRVDRAGSQLKIKNQCHRTKVHLQRNKNTCDKKTFAFCLWQLVRSPPKRTKGTATNPRLIQVWSRARSAFRTLLCLHYCQIRAAERPFNRDDFQPEAQRRARHRLVQNISWDTVSSVIGRLFGVIRKEKKHVFHHLSRRHVGADIFLAQLSCIYHILVVINIGSSCYINFFAN